jgi:hypothetical protein
MNREPRTAALTLLLCLPTSLALGYVGAELSTPPEPPSGPTACRGHDLERELASLRAELEERVRALAEATTAQRGAPAPVAIATERRPTPSGPITEAEIERFQELEQSVARHRSILARQSRARVGVARLCRDAGTDGTRAIDDVLERCFGDERQLLAIDRNALDEAGRRQLERARADLRERTLAELSQRVDQGLARAITDQLWLGHAPGQAVQGGSFRAIGEGELSASPGVVPGVDRTGARR